jgi:2-dehydropantoate 2-reductase
VREQGLRLDDLGGRTEVRVPASDQAAALGPQDLVFLCSKSQDLPALARSVLPAIGPQTLVIPWSTAFPSGTSTAAATASKARRCRRWTRTASAAQPADGPGAGRGGVHHRRIARAGLVRLAHTRTDHAGRAGRRPDPAPAGRLPAAGERRHRRPAAGAHPRQALDQDRNLASTPLSVVTGATLEEIYTRDSLLPTVQAVMHEVMLAASAYGARLEIDPIEFVQLGAAMGPVRTSMLQDLERGRPLELAAIGDAMVELGALRPAHARHPGPDRPGALAPTLSPGRGAPASGRSPVAA